MIDVTFTGILRKDRKDYNWIRSNKRNSNIYLILFALQPSRFLFLNRCKKRKKREENLLQESATFDDPFQHFYKSSRYELRCEVMKYNVGGGDPR